jgi:hypothetical protein
MSGSINNLSPAKREKIRILFKDFNEKMKELVENEGMSKFMKEYSEDFAYRDDEMILPYSILDKKEKDMGFA